VKTEGEEAICYESPERAVYASDGREPIVEIHHQKESWKDEISYYVLVSPFQGLIIPSLFDGLTPIATISRPVGAFIA
jgi:hypothetical protein